MRLRPLGVWHEGGGTCVGGGGAGLGQQGQQEQQEHVDQREAVETQQSACRHGDEVTRRQQTANGDVERTRRKEVA